MKPLGLLIFDLDGTLADTREDIAASVNHALARFGRDPLPLEVVQQIVGDGVRVLLSRAFGGDEALAVEAGPVYGEHYRQNLVNATALYPTVKETLDHFAHLPMAVITNKAQGFSGSILEHLGIREYFSVIIGADSGLPLKPAPDSILRIVDEFGVPKERAAMVGDGTTDMLAGKAAGIITCAVTYGFRSEEELKKTDPDYIIHELSELKTLFTRTI